MADFFVLPDEYSVRADIAPSAFSKKAELTRTEKKRFVQAVKTITITSQIAGERIPSRMDEEYNVQVIQCFDIQLDNLKNAPFAAGVIQRLIKPPAVLLFTEGTNDARLNMAIKRLNRNNPDEIVIDKQFTTSSFNILPGDDTYRLLKRHVAFGSLKNLQDKAAMYIEWYVKTMIIDQRKIIPQAEELLSSSVFYDMHKTLALLSLLCEYHQTLDDQAQENTLANKAACNTKLKKITSQLTEHA